MKITFFSTECYPAAKVGGLGDVAGSLPKYLNKQNGEVRVIIPKYRMPWLESQTYDVLHTSDFYLGAQHIHFQVEKVIGDPLGFEMLVIDIPGKFDRYGVYAGENGNYFVDEVERYAAFARAALQFLQSEVKKPDVIHCHDHHMGLIPFMAQNCYGFRDLSEIPLVFTIHNERYQGAFGWDRQYLIPEFDTWKSGQLDWNHRINPLASAVKCSWKVTTVSQSYMEELKRDSFGLEWLFQAEGFKCQGILNGIDNEYWDPVTDPLITHPMKRSATKFKKDNKAALLNGTGLDPALPLISFIGRFALEKGADLISGIIDRFLSQDQPVQFLVLGTGDKTMENHLAAMGYKFPSKALVHIAYDEKLAHQIYAGSDFLIMPSRVEPCGLNQMYSMRYGTIPIVNDLGGLKDSVTDISQKNGSGIKMHNLAASTIDHAIYRALELFNDSKELGKVVTSIMKIDNSWDQSAHSYMEMYKSLKK